MSSFRVNIIDFWDVTHIQELKAALGVSQATIYRAIKQAQLPIYYIPNHPGLPIIHSATLWKLTKAPMFNKLVNRSNICIGDEDMTRGKGDNITTFDLVSQGLLPLPIDKAINAAKLGLLPMIPNTNYIFKWFIDYLRGYIKFPLPRKR